MLRIACSRVVPYAFRAAGSPRIASPRMTNALVSVAKSDRRFSSDSFSCWVNGMVVAALDSEINTIQLIKERPLPPPNFTLKTESISPYSGHVLLTRELDGEEIDVRLLDSNLSDIVVGATDSDSDTDTDTDSDSDSDTDSTDNSSDEEKEKEEAVESIPLKIEITKANGKSLKFAAAASADGIRIDRLTTKEGTKVICSQLFIKPESELQTALREFLAERGIGKCMAAFLNDLMIWKSKIPQERRMILEQTSARNDPHELNKLRMLKEVIGAW